MSKFATVCPVSYSLFKLLDQMSLLLDYIRILEFEEDPDYSLISCILRSIISKEEIHSDSQKY